MVETSCSYVSCVFNDGYCCYNSLAIYSSLKFALSFYRPFSNCVME